tara:strand:- start:2028 stop:3407 length:1380 start_codon:yes stop_codon:yes gene_type:complete
MLKTPKIKKNINLLLTLTAIATISPLMLFARPYVGLSFKGILLGQVVIGCCLFLFILTFIPHFSRVVKNYAGDKFVITYQLIVLSFFILAGISESNFLDPYPYKTSSYIWTISILFVSILFFAKVDIEYKYFKILLLIPFLIYLFSTGNYPDVVINFFKENSDKFQFLKASDLMISVISVNIFTKRIIKNEETRFIYIALTSAAFIPLLLFMSRGSFLGLTVYLIIEFYINRNLLKKIPIKAVLIVFSTLMVFTSSLFYVDYLYINEDTKTLNFEVLEPGIASTLSSSISDLALKDESRKIFFSFYIHYGRVESKDPTTNWRLDIWQDIVYDQIDENRLFTGYGYKEILPQMTDPTAPGRLGRDGLNENVHSYIFNIIARGGLIQFFLFLYLYYCILQKWFEKNKNYNVVSLIFPVILTASLDIAMEGVQYPVIFFFTLGFLLVNEQNKHTSTKVYTYN